MCIALLTAYEFRRGFCTLVLSFILHAHAHTHTHTHTHTHAHTHTPFCRFLRYTAPVSVEPVSLDIANGKESGAGGEDGKTVEEAESILVATPTNTPAIETAPTTG